MSQDESTTSPVIREFKLKHINQNEKNKPYEVYDTASREMINNKLY